MDKDYQALFVSLKKKSIVTASMTFQERRKKLKHFLKTFIDYRPKIHEAMYADFRKSPEETDISEIYAVTSETRHALRNLKSWMRPHPVSTSLVALGTTSYITYESLGVILNISPSNFPFNLTFGPLVNILAAGNTAVLKPSEHTRHSAILIEEIVQKCFSPDEVLVCNGGPEVSQALLQLPFDHIFFTGSPRIGKIVYEHAATNLVPVTLELGGKSPTILDESVNLKKIAPRINWSKYINGGQMCISTDYLLVHASQEDEIVTHLITDLKKRYTDQPLSSPFLARCAHPDLFHRLKTQLAIAIEDGAVIRYGGQSLEEELFIAPTIISGVPLASPLMQDEIFGPILPIITYRHLDEAINIINQLERPLTMNIYSKSKRNIHKIMAKTRAGSTCINTNTLYYYEPNLPFGGVGHSGMGRAHGFYAFQSFSNARSIMKEFLPIGAVDLVKPPFNNFSRKLLDLIIRWF